MNIRLTEGGRPGRVVSSIMCNGAKFNAHVSADRFASRAPNTRDGAMESDKRRAAHVLLTESNSLSVAFEQAIPLLAQEGPTKRDVRNACLAGRTVQPTQDVVHTLEFADVLGSAAYRGEGYRASTAADEGRLGSSEQQSMDL